MELPSFVRRRPGLFWTGVCLLLLGTLLQAVFAWRKDVAVTRIRASIGEGRVIPLLVYRPRALAGKMPAVVVCHGMASSREMMELFSVEICRRGYVVAAPDFPGDGPEENIDIVKSLVAYVQSIPSVEAGSVALVGHSLGGIEAAYAAFGNLDVKATAAFGIFIGGELNLEIHNVLLATGLYDRLHGPAIMVDSLRSLTGGAVSAPGVLWGSLAKGDARKLVVSPYSEHGSEAVDPLILTETLDWLDATFARKGGKKPLISYHWQLAGVACSRMGMAILLLFGLLVMPGDRRTMRQAGVAFLVFSAVIAASAVAGDDEAFSDILLVGVLSVSLVWANRLRQVSYSGAGALERLESALRALARGLAVIWGSLCVSAVLFESWRIAAEPSALWGVPLYLLFSYLVYPLFSLAADLNHLQASNPFLLAALMLVPAALMALELKRPGVVGEALARRRPGPAPLCPARPGRTPGGRLMLLAVLAAGAALAWWSIMSKADAWFIVTTMGFYGAKYVVVPLALAGVFFRIRSRR